MTYLEILFYTVLILISVLVAYLVLIIALMGMGLKNKFSPPAKQTNMHERIFNRVVGVLMRYAKFFKISYYEINIIVYYFLVPFSWLVLIDWIFNFHYLKIGFILFCIGFAFLCKDFSSFSIRLYKQSVDFLNYFNRFGSNYVASSVWICIVVPVLIYSTLIYFVIY
jgi:hypothetical protein